MTHQDILELINSCSPEITLQELCDLFVQRNPVPDPHTYGLQVMPRKGGRRKTKSPEVWLDKTKTLKAAGIKNMVRCTSNIDSEYHTVRLRFNFEGWGALPQKERKVFN